MPVCRPLYFVRHLLGPRAIEPVFERTVGIDRFFAHQAMIGAGHSVEATAASLDGFTIDDSTDGHSHNDDRQQAKCKDKCCHVSLVFRVLG